MRLRIPAVALAAAIAICCVLAAAPALAARRGHRHHGHAVSAKALKPGIYDCYDDLYGMLEYMESYQFELNGRYGLGSRLHGDKLTGKIDWGRYVVRGKRIFPTSGQLKEDRYFMKIENRNEVAMFHDGGKATGIGCYFHKP